MSPNGYFIAFFCLKWDKTGLEEGLQVITIFQVSQLRVAE